MRLFALLALACLATASAAGAAERERPSRTRCPDLALLAVYLEQATGFPALELCPLVTFSVHAPEASGRPHDRGMMRRTGRAYFPGSAAILMSPKTDPTSVPGMAALLHELVHAYQYALGLDTQVRCRDALEPLAFRVEEAFLRDNGYDAEADEVARMGAIRGICAGYRMSD